MIDPFKTNKLPQERNLYLISFPRYSSSMSFKMRHPVYNSLSTEQKNTSQISVKQI